MSSITLSGLSAVGQSDELALNHPFSAARPFEVPEAQPAPSQCLCAPLLTIPGPVSYCTPCPHPCSSLRLEGPGSPPGSPLHSYHPSCGWAPPSCWSWLSCLMNEGAVSSSPAAPLQLSSCSGSLAAHRNPPLPNSKHHWPPSQD